MDSKVVELRKLFEPESKPEIFALLNYLMNQARHYPIKHIHVSYLIGEGKSRAFLQLDQTQFKEDQTD